MPDFLAENNICGQTILQLVSRGNAIIAELLRLKNYIPKIFRLSTKEEIHKYCDIILDFSYFKIEDVQNAKIENSEVLLELDDQFRKNHIEMINRFYLIFESIHNYITDLNHFLEELDEGIYIHQSLETIFMDMEGKQLLCESLYLYGLMLLMVDEYIEGIIRERLLVSYYRYTPQRSDIQSKIDDVCKLLRDTGNSSAKRPNNYPEDFFKRIPIKPTFIDMVIGHLRTDDIYGQLAVYPLPKHRSTALATQASMLYVCLFFSPNILHSQTAIMREIVDKYFPDNWVISLYMGFIINLAESWEVFKAAKLALNNTLESVNIKEYATNYGASIPKLLKSCSEKLSEGFITDETLLKDINDIISLLRDCNFTIRWLMLHTLTKVNSRTEKNKRIRQLRELVITESKYDQVLLFKLLLHTAQLELITRETYKNLLTEKEDQWKNLKEESHRNLIELSEVFSGAKVLSRVQKNDKLQEWFMEISKQVDSLDQNDTGSGRKIVQLIQALEEVQEFHQLDSNMQIMQCLSEIRKYLHQMIRNMNVKEDILITLQIIGDLSYAWELIDSFTPIMQLGIKQEPTLVIKLRAIFLKLSSALEIPLLRINQAHSEDLISVSQYYSSELEIYVRKVLQIIPKMMFEKMARIIEIQTSILKEMPTRLDKDHLKDYAQLNERFEYAELTHSISVFSQGMRMMKSTLVGVICLDPKKLLEDGIRKELVLCISKALHTELIFNPKSKVVDELRKKLESLGTIMDGYKKSFEYIQDYININALKIWQEEVTRIINYNVEQECNNFLRCKVGSWDSIFQSRYVPIPIYPSVDNINENFIGRLAREIIRTTDPKQSVYLHHTSSWYELKTHKLVLNKETIKLVASAIEISGLVGLDRLFSFMIVSNLQKIARFLEHNQSEAWRNIMTHIRNEFANIEHMPNPLKFYQNCISRTNKFWNEFLDYGLTIGQLQLLRNLIAFHLNMSSRFNAKNLESSLRSLNNALMLDIKSGKYSPNEELLSTLSDYFDYSGLNNPLQKIYITSRFNENYAYPIFLFVISHLGKLFFVQNPANLHKKTLDQFDGVAFAVFVHTFLKQFHPDLNKKFIDLLSNYIMQYAHTTISNKGAELPAEVTWAVSFLDTYTNYSDMSRKFLRDSLPEEIALLLHNITLKE